MATEQGEAEVVRDGEHVATLGPGEVFGEVGVLEQTLRAASVVATTPVRLVTLSRWDLARAEGALDEIHVALQERRPLGSSPT